MKRFILAGPLFLLLAACGKKTAGKVVRKARGEAGPKRIEPPTRDVAPASGRIAFTSRRKGDYGIYVMKAEGSEVQRLKSGWFSSWSPDGRRMACVQFFNDTGRFDVVVMDADGSNLKRLTNASDRDSKNPDWSPDGKRIAFESGDINRPDIWVMNADGSDQRSLAPHESSDTAPA